LVDKTIFKAYDIRGIYPDQLDEVLANKIGKAFVHFVKKQYPDKDKVTIVVSRDMRLSSPSLSEQVIKGITSQGADVLDIGLASSPTFYFAVGFLKADGGIQVSASHNPKEYNGMKIVLQKGYPVGLANGLDWVRDKCIEDDFADGELGTVTEKSGILDELVKFSMKAYDFSGTKKFKIVADVANAMSSLDLTALFKVVESDLIEMNFKLDGTFPAHQADPFQEKNVVDIKRKVIDGKADLGIATDGDGLQNH